MRVIPGLKTGASVGEAVRLLGQTFRAAGIEDAETDARILTAHALNLDRARLIAQSDRVLEAREINVISGLAARRLRREPVSRILGRREFWSLPIMVTPDVLVPRPETETIVEGTLDFVVRGGLSERRERWATLKMGVGESPTTVGQSAD